MLRKQKTRAWLLSVAALVLFISNFITVLAEEPDPRILWVSDSSIVKIDGFAVHPNGNIFAYRNGFKELGVVKRELSIYEIDGTNGKLIRELPKFSEEPYIESIDISYDGKYLATSFDGVTIVDLSDLSSKTFGNGNRVTFVPNSKKIAYRASGGGPKFHDSSIVILDLETQERNTIGTVEMIDIISFSPDGRFFATGGGGKDNYGKFYTSLKLWDAKTLTVTRELGGYEKYQIGEIKFSQNGQLVGFKGGMGLIIFNTKSFEKHKQYSNDIVFDYMLSFEFYDENKIIAQSKHTVLINMDLDSLKTVFEIETRSKIKLNQDNTKIYVCSFYKNQYGPLMALNMQNIISTVNEIPLNREIQTEYQKEILLISGIEFINNSIQLEIYDINGKIIRQLNVESNGTELRIPIILPNGTYLLNLTDGSKKYSSKFIVTE